MIIQNKIIAIKVIRTKCEGKKIEGVGLKF